LREALPSTMVEQKMTARMETLASCILLFNGFTGIHPDAEMTMPRNMQAVMWHSVKNTCCGGVFVEPVYWGDTSLAACRKHEKREQHASRFEVWTRTGCLKPVFDSRNLLPSSTRMFVAYQMIITNTVDVAL